MIEQAAGRKVHRAQEAREPRLDAPKLFLNRELSLVEFIGRVLAQAREPRHPLLDRVRFLALANNAIDELFMVRVSDLQDQIGAQLEIVGADGMTPAQQLVAVRQHIVKLYREMTDVLNAELLPELTDHGIRVVDLQELSASQRGALRTYFEREVFPVLTPLAVDPGHPFPHISNLSVNLAVELASDGTESRFARLKIPDVINRLVHVEAILSQPPEGKKPKATFVWLDQLVAQNLSALFPGVPVLGWYPFRVIRDADIEYHEEEGSDLRLSVERGLRQRRFGEAVQLTVEQGMPDRIRSLLVDRLGLTAEDVYVVDRPLGLNSVMELVGLDRPDLKYPPLVPRLPQSIPPGEPIAETIDRHDIALYHPYDSFAPVLDFLRSSANNESVLAIKQTLYRVGTDAPVVRALLDAVNHGKQVAVLVELKARFDEASNIEWARELERAGVHVVYGLLGLKTHAKLALVIRKEVDGLHRYVHLGTGNYNVSTARSYCDLSLFTDDPDFGADATDLFNFLTGYSEQRSYRKFLVAPLNLRESLLHRIDTEIRSHQETGDGHLIFKMNGLVDREFIQALYRASQAGVKVDVLCRGICCLRPGVKGVSDNIRVISIIGRFLEHARVYYFANGGSPVMFAGSADLMPRNLDYRVEVLFPIEAPRIRDNILNNLLLPQLRDTCNAWRMHSNGTYERVTPSDGEAPFDSQAWNMAHGIEG